MTKRIEQRIERKDTSEGWSSNNTVLLDGEFGYEEDTKKGKYGDGVTPWNELPYSIVRVTYGTEVPTDGTDGDIYFKIEE